MQNKTVLFSDISTIWENTDGCAEQYRCETALYLLSIFTHVYNIIIDCGVVTSGYGREVVDGLNYTNKRFLSMLLKTVQLTGEKSYEPHMAMHTSTTNIDISLEGKFQKHLSDLTWAHGLLDHGIDRKSYCKQKQIDCEYHVQEIKEAPHI